LYLDSSKHALTCTWRRTLQTNISSSSTPTGVISGPYFALVINRGATIVGFSSLTGKLLWSKDVPGTQYTEFVACSGQHFCISTFDVNAILFLEGPTGVQRWSHPGNGVTTHGTSEDYVVIGDGDGYLNERFVYLVDAKSGNMVWNVSLGEGRTGGDWALTPDFVLVTYAIIEESVKRNAYPSCIGGFRLSDGVNVFTAAPLGDTMGILSFFKNYDFTALGDEEVAHYDGHTGKEVCAVQHIMAYNMITQPATYGDSFFVTYFNFGWTTQMVLRLSFN